MSLFHKKEIKKDAPAKIGNDVVAAPQAINPKSVAPRSPIAKKEDPEAYKILLEPLITEKATDLAALGKYIFKVPVTTNKSEVIKKVENIYGVAPVKVNFVRKRGKFTRSGRVTGWTKDFKKAIVTLRPGDKIEIYEGV